MWTRVGARDAAPTPIGGGTHGSFTGPGEMVARCRAFDWAATPLGPVSQWSHSLRTIVATIMETRHPMFLWWGPELVQIFNDGYLPSFGTSGRDLTALGARGREHWADVWPVIGPQIEGVMSRGEATWHEDQYLPIERNGSVEDVWWTYGYSPVRDDDGTVAGVLVVVQETTARMKALAERERLVAALETERSRLMEVFRRAPSFIAVVRGPSHHFEFVNEAYYQVVGHRRILGRPLLEALPEMREQGYMEILDQVRETGQPWVGRETPALLQRTPGSPLETRYLDMVFQAFTEADGTRSGVVAHGSDVTEQVLARREVERLLAESERARLEAEAARERSSRLHALSAALSMASAPEEVAEAITAHVSTIFGAVGVPIARLSDDGEQLATLLDALGQQANAISPLILEERVLGVMGLAFDTPRIFDAGERALILTVASLCAQAFERARLYESERVARRDAELANRAKSDFLAVMSHELRTPLNAIGGYAELMELGIHGPVTAEQAKALARIQQSQRHLLGLINGVLNYSRVEAGAVHYTLADVPMDEVLATCEALTAPQVRAKRLYFRYDGCDPQLAAHGDREKVQQIVLNLISNAVKFTEPGGSITLDCFLRDDAMVIVRMTDTGRGIAADQIERVFQPFVQLDAKLTRTQEGTGLGLAISRDLARGMSGDLVVESTPQSGSAFTLTIPAA